MILKVNDYLITAIGTGCAEVNNVSGFLKLINLEAVEVEHVVNYFCRAKSDLMCGKDFLFILISLSHVPITPPAGNDPVRSSKIDGVDGNSGTSILVKRGILSSRYLFNQSTGVFSSESLAII